MIVNDELSRMEFSSVKSAVSIGSISAPVVSLNRRTLTSAISQEDMECHERVFRGISEARKKFDEVCREYEKMLSVKFTLDGDKFPIVRAKDLVRDYVRTMENEGIMDYDTLKEAIRLREQLDHEMALDLFRR